MRRIKKKQGGILKSLSIKIRLIIVGSVLCFLALAAFFSGETGQKFINKTTELYHQIISRTQLTFRIVSIEGHKRTSKEDIIRAFNLEQGTPILDIDLSDIQNKIAELPWVDSVSVERHLPSTIYIRIVEKTPIAVWQSNKKYFPLDETGEPIDDNRTKLNNLLLVVGRDAPEYTSDLIVALNKYPTIKELVVSAVRVGDRRWNLILHDVNDGINVYLPEIGIEEALSRLVEAQKTDEVLSKDLKVIDLRIEDRLIIRTDANLIDEKD
ncbi:MAG: FtsQ-type POTRA domain-containing protein [Alphaproteobacteria bacterium]|nr:FtsQ-type POTRA domain-containing protein [Alphaproteobacteria bacterium]